MKKLTFDNLVIETTRCCNMECSHCLRGDAENTVIDTKYIDALFRHVTSIGQLTITGGEPSLFPEKIDEIVDLARAHEISIGSFYIATNGKQITDAFVMAVIRLWLYCDDNEISQVQLSNDGYHEEDGENKQWQKLSALSFFGKKQEHDGDTYHEGRYPGMIAEGRGADNYPGRQLNLETFDIDEEDETQINEGTFYLNSKGMLIAGCDLSYDTQDEVESLQLLSWDKFSVAGIIEAVKIYEAWKETEGVETVDDAKEQMYCV